MEIAVLIIAIVSALLAAAQVYYGRLSLRSPVPEPKAGDAGSNPSTNHPCYYLLIDAHPKNSMHASEYGWGDRSSENVLIDGKSMPFDATDFDRPHVFVLKNMARGTYPVRITVRYVNDKPTPTTHVADLVLGDSLYYRMRWQPAVTVEPSRDEHLQITAVSEPDFKAALTWIRVPNCASSPSGITYTP